MQESQHLALRSAVGPTLRRKRPMYFDSGASWRCHKQPEGSSLFAFLTDCVNLCQTTKASLCAQTYNQHWFSSLGIIFARGLRSCILSKINLHRGASCSLKGLACMIQAFRPYLFTTCHRLRLLQAQPGLLLGETSQDHFKSSEED